MAREEKQVEMIKEPISHEKIYKIMLWVVFPVAGVFFLKNVFEMNISGMIVIGIGLLALASMLFIMKKKRTADVKKEFVMSLSFIFLIFMISLYSGESYSDDFALYLAAIGLAGMYLEPKFVKTQIIVADIALVLMYIIHPEKGGDLGQYIMCTGVFTLAGILFYLTVVRGRAFIEIARRRANDTEVLLESMRRMGKRIEEDFIESSGKIAESTVSLQKGSNSITSGAGMISVNCSEVHNKIQHTQERITGLNKQVKTVETLLSTNESNMEIMQGQCRIVSEIVDDTNEVFQTMKEEMGKISTIAGELGDIALRVTLLALNASVEAAHVGGTSGTGFGVVATEMKGLADSSDRFAKEVEEVVVKLLENVEKTSEKFAGSTTAIEKSKAVMRELQNSFTNLTAQFSNLYDNIEEQNQNIHQVDEIFGGLETRISEMREFSEENQFTVQEIVEAMDGYKESISLVIESTRRASV